MKKTDDMDDLENAEDSSTLKKENTDQCETDSADDNKAAEEKTEEETGQENASQTEDGEKDGDSEVKKDKKDKKEKKDKKDILIDELTDKYKRTFAEFDNYRKRTEKEKSAMFEVGAKSIIEKILPVIDNFERGLALVTEEQKEDPFIDGVNKIYKQLMTCLEEAGVKPIEALNSQFDPNLHNAVMHVEDESLGENIVVEEFQKGYMYRDSVVRHSMVSVVQ